MENKFSTTAVGAFVLVLGVALVAGVLWLAAGVNGKRNDLPYQSVLAESVAGLNIDAPVKFLGVDVGKVHTIAIDPQNARQVLLGFQLARGTPVKQDSEAVLKTQGLTGIVYVELSGGTPGSPPLLATAEAPVPMIRSRPSLSTRLENVLGTVLTGLDRMSGNLNAVFDADNRAALKQTLADIASVTHTVAAQQDAISAGLRDAALTAKLTAQAGAELTPMLTRVSTSAVAVTQLAHSAEATVQCANIATDSAASGIQQLRDDTLPQLERLMLDLSQLAGSLRTLSEQTERNPSSLLTGRPKLPPGPGETTP